MSENTAPAETPPESSKPSMWVKNPNTGEDLLYNATQHLTFGAAISDKKKIEEILDSYRIYLQKFKKDAIDQVAGLELPIDSANVMFELECNFLTSSLLYIQNILEGHPTFAQFMGTVDGVEKAVIVKVVAGLTQRGDDSVHLNFGVLLFHGVKQEGPSVAYLIVDELTEEDFIVT